MALCAGRNRSAYKGYRDIEMIKSSDIDTLIYINV